MRSLQRAPSGARACDLRRLSAARAAQVNGLRQERVADVMCPGFVSGTNSYDARTLCGNWAEERCDKAYRPSEHKASRNNEWQFSTSSQAQAKIVKESHKALPAKGSNSLTPYTHPESELATGQVEASKLMLVKSEATVALVREWRRLALWHSAKW